MELLQEPRLLEEQQLVEQEESEMEEPPRSMKARTLTEHRPYSPLDPSSLSSPLHWYKR